MLKRRTFLRGAAAASAVAIGGALWRARARGVFASGEGPAYAAWHDWRNSPVGHPLALVRAAILAANPHNTQPWSFRVARERIDVFANPARNIGLIDPFRREMYAGIGCALENLALAAAANGFAAEVTLAPDRANTAHAARVDLTPAAVTRSALYNAIPLRHTNRGPYRRNAPIAPASLAALQALASNDADVRVLWIASGEAHAELGKLIVRATEAIVNDREQSRDSAAWYRLEWDELQKHRDGVTVNAMGAGALISAAVKWLPPLSTAQNDGFWLDATRDVHVASAAAFGVLALRDLDAIEQRLRAGRLWQRLHLWATLHGLALQPLNQIPERIAREQRDRRPPEFAQALAALHGERDAHALMLFRAGYPERRARPSPRRALEAVLLE